MSDDSDGRDGPTKRPRLSDAGIVTSDSESDESIPVAAKLRRKRLIVASGAESDSSGSVIVSRRRRIPALPDSDSVSSGEETDCGPSSRRPASGSCSDSSEGNSDKCSICLVPFKDQVIGTPEACEHIFCLDCITEWSRNVNTCPVDRKEFKSIVVRACAGGEVLRSVPVIQEAIIVEDGFINCEICGNEGEEDEMLICYNCHLGFHMSCLNPPFEEVPEEDWYCSECEDMLNASVRPVRNAPNVLYALIRYSQRLLNAAVPQNNAPSTSHAAALPTSGGSRSRYTRTRAVPATAPRRRATKRRKRRTRTVTAEYEIQGEGKFPIRRNVKRRVTKRKARRRTKRAAAPRPAARRAHVRASVRAQLAALRSEGDQCTPSVSELNGRRRRAGIPALSLFGDRFSLEPCSEEEFTAEGGAVAVAARPTSTVVSAYRQARRKMVCLPPSPQQATSASDLLDSIMESQELLHNKRSITSVTVDGTVNITLRKRLVVDGDPVAPTSEKDKRVNVSECTDSARKVYGGHGGRSSGGGGGWGGGYRGRYPPPHPADTTHRGNNWSPAAGRPEPRFVRGGGGERPVTYGRLPPPDAPYQPLRRPPHPFRPYEQRDQQRPAEHVNPYQHEQLPIDMRAAALIPQNNREHQNHCEQNLVIDTDKYDPTEPTHDDEDPNTSNLCEEEGNDNEPLPEPPFMPLAPPPEPPVMPLAPPPDPPIMPLALPPSPPIMPLAPPPDPPNIGDENSVKTSLLEGCVRAAMDEHRLSQPQQMHSDGDSDGDCPNFSIYSATSVHIASTGSLSAPGYSDYNQRLAKRCPITPSPREPIRIKLHTSSLMKRGLSLYDEEDSEPATETTENPPSTPPLSPPADDRSLPEPDASPKVASNDSTPTKDEPSIGKGSKDVADDGESDAESNQGDEQNTPSDIEMSAPAQTNADKLKVKHSDDDRDDKAEELDLEDNDDINGSKSDIESSKSDGARATSAASAVDEALEKMTESISEAEDDLNERSFTPCLDERRPTSSPGASPVLGTELISDDELNHMFSDEHSRSRSRSKSKSKSPSKSKSRSKSKSPQPAKKKKKESKKQKDKENKMKSKTKAKKDVTFKKLSKSGKERNYRDRDKDDKDKDKKRVKDRRESVERRRRKERRQDLQRYDVRSVLNEKRRPVKDAFGRDLSPPNISPSPKRSMSPRRKSISPRRRSVSPFRRKSISPRRRSPIPLRRKSVSPRQRSISPRRRSPSPRRRSITPRTISPRKRSITPRRISMSRRRSRSPFRRKSIESPRRRSITPRKRISSPRKRTVSPRRQSISPRRKSLSPRRHQKSPSPLPRKKSPVRKRKRSPSPKIKKKKKRDVSRKKSPKRKSPKRKRKRSPVATVAAVAPPQWSPSVDSHLLSPRTPPAVISPPRRRHHPPPQKEVFTSGDNILVSVSFKEQQGDGLIERRARKEAKRTRRRRRAAASTAAAAPAVAGKPVAIIDLDRSPFREMTPSPKHVIVLSDSDHEDEDKETPVPKPAPEKPAAPEIPPAISVGPKTPPEPVPARSAELAVPMAQPSPDAYDPFEPTHSPSPARSPKQDGPARHMTLETAQKTNLSADEVLDRQPVSPIEKVMALLQSTRDEAPEPPPRDPPAPSLATSAPAAAPVAQQQAVAPRVVLPHPQPPKLFLGKPSPIKSNPVKPMVATKVTTKLSRLPLPPTCDSPYSPGSSDFGDLFSPPTPPQEAPGSFDVLFDKPPRRTKRHGHSTIVQVKFNRKRANKEVGVMMDDESLKILDELPSSAVEMQVRNKFLKKLNRQERVIEEVKHMLEPHYNKRHITKQDYKDILRRAVPKIYHSKSGEINPAKVQALVEAYVNNARKRHKFGHRHA